MEVTFLSAHPGEGEERGKAGCLSERIGKWEKEGSHNMSIHHKLNHFHKSDSQMGAVHHPHPQSSPSISAQAHTSRLQAQKCDLDSFLGPPARLRQVKCCGNKSTAPSLP